MNSDLVANLLIISFLIIFLLTFYFGVKERGRKIFISILYFLAIAYMSFQGLYFEKILGGTSPDESAHISYVYYLHETDEIIPTFENMKLFSSYSQKWSIDYYEYQLDSVNYVCHPPLYYQIMKIPGGFSYTEDPAVIQINKHRLRLFSMIIYLGGIGLLLYIGYSRIPKKKPWMHLLYCTAATSVPMLSYELCAVTNDALALGTGCLCILGLIRFCEKRRDYSTYILIATGITASLLTKMTTALLCIIMALIILVFSMIRERSFKACLPFEFWVSAPIYLIAIIYYLIMYSRYHAIQPSLELICSKEYFENTIYYTTPALRVPLSKKQYLSYYLKKFFLSWSGIEASVPFMKQTVFSKSTLPSELLWIFPVLLLIPQARRKSAGLPLPVFSGWVACVITFLIQLKSAYGSYLTRGYLGGFQSRYYLPFLFAFGLGAVYFFQGLQIEIDSSDDEAGRFDSCSRHLLTREVLHNNLVDFIALGYTFMLFYGNYPFFLSKRQVIGYTKKVRSFYASDLFILL